MTYYRSVAVDNRQALAAFEAGLKLAPNNADLLGTAALAEQSLGRWDAALTALRRRARSTPARPTLRGVIAQACSGSGAIPRREAAADRGLALAPTNLDLIEKKAMVDLAQGDLPGARAVDPRGPGRGRAHRARRLHRQLLGPLLGAGRRPAAAPAATRRRRLYDDDRGTWGIVRASTY